MRLLSTLLSLSLFTSSIIAETRTYVGTNPSNWNNPSTWSDGQIPTANDDVILPTSTKLTFDSDTPITIQSLKIGSGSSLYFNISNPLYTTSPLLTIKTLTFDNTISETIVVDGVNLAISSSFSTQGITTTSRLLSFTNFAQLSVASTATTTFSSTSPTTLTWTENSIATFEGVTSVTGTVTVEGAINFNADVNVAQDAVLNVNGAFGKFSAGVTLGAGSRLQLSGLCTFETTSHITGTSTSSIVSTGETSFLGVANVALPYTVSAGNTVFTSTATISDISIASNAILSINNNATIAKLSLTSNSTVGTVANTQSRAGIVVDDMIVGLTSTPASYIINGVNLVSRRVAITSTNPITVILLNSATWVWLNNITSNVAILVATSDESSPRLLHVGSIQAPSVVIHTCYINSGSGRYNGLLTTSSVAGFTVTIPTFMTCANATDIIIPNDALTNTTTPTFGPIPPIIRAPDSNHASLSTYSSIIMFVIITFTTLLL